MNLAVGDQSLSVRLSELLEKSVPRKIFEIFLWVATSKTDLRGARGMVKLQVPLPSSQFTCLLSQNALLFPELPFYFPEVLFSFLELLLCFSGVLVCSLELPFCFLAVRLCFPEVPFNF